MIVCRNTEEYFTKQYVLDNLDRALEEQWIHFYYQPIVLTEDAELFGEESLARWFDPVYGVLLPQYFVPILEDAGLIYHLDLYAVKQALKVLCASDRAHMKPISVNISRTDFHSCDMVEEIRALVDEAGVGRDKLIIEITESSAAGSIDFIRQQVERFQELGFSVWMDDFGSGYSTLDLLRSIHFDLIKFDKCFMQRFREHRDSPSVLAHLIQMAAYLQVDTLCEGVETEEQAAFLREIGCSKAQGYYFGKAVPIEATVAASI